jgi:hypothetical protein
MRLVVLTLLATSVDSPGNEISPEQIESYNEVLLKVANEHSSGFPHECRIDTTVHILPQEGPDRGGETMDHAFHLFQENAGEHDIKHREQVLRNWIARADCFEKRFCGLMQRVAKANGKAPHAELLLPDCRVPIHPETYIMAEVDREGRIQFRTWSCHASLWGMIMHLEGLYNGGWPEEVVESAELDHIFPELFEGMTAETSEFTLICQGHMKDLAMKAIAERESA